MKTINVSMNDEDFEYITRYKKPGESWIIYLKALTEFNDMNKPPLTELKQ